MPSDPSTGDHRTSPLRPRPASRSLRIAGTFLSLTGSLVGVVGTFAPWLTSGGVDRDSYAIAGIAARLGLAGRGFGAIALNGWPFVGPVAMLVLIAAILRWWRTSAWIGIAFGVLTGVIGGGVMAVAGGHAAVGIMLAEVGPVITVIGAALSIVGGAVVLVSGRRRPIRVARSPGEFAPDEGTGWRTVASERSAGTDGAQRAGHERVREQPGHAVKGSSPR